MLKLANCGLFLFLGFRKSHLDKEVRNESGKEDEKNR